MPATRPTADQLRFNSAANGESVLDDYMEAVEKGGRSLPDLLDELFDALGALKNFVDFREDPANAGDLQFRLGEFIDPEAGWQTFTSTDFSTFVTNCTNAQSYAEEWANANEDQLISAAAGGNQSDEYSAKHHSLKAAAIYATILAGGYTIANNITVQGGSASYYWYEDDASVDNRRWVMYANGEEMVFQALTDAGAGGGDLWKFERFGNDIQRLLGQNGGATTIMLDNQQGDIEVTGHFQVNHTGGTADKNTRFIQNNDHLMIQNVSDAGVTGNVMLEAYEHGGVYLRHNNTRKLWTASDGIYVDGNIFTPDDNQLRFGSFASIERDSATEELQINTATIDVDIVLSTNNTERMRISGNGDVTINGTLTSSATDDAVALAIALG